MIKLSYFHILLSIPSILYYLTNANLAKSEIVTPPLQSRIKAERGIHISNSITAEELYTAYKEVRDEYDECAFHSNQKWQVLRKSGDKNDDEIEIAIKQHASDSSCPYVRMTAIMPGSVEEVWDFLQLQNWDKTMPKMDPFYEGLTMIKTYRYKKKSGGRLFEGDGVVTMELARKRTKRFLTFGKRDFAFVSVADVPVSDGIWVSGTISVLSDKLLPRKKGYTRGFQDSIAFYEAIPSTPDNKQERTKLTIICRIDLNDSGEGGGGGSIPMWLYVKTVGTTGLVSMSNMRKHLQKDILDKMKCRERK